MGRYVQYGHGMTTAETLHLASPPVVAVRFSFHFDCSRPISLSDVTDFIAASKNQFPRISEARPLPPAFNNLDNDLFSSGTWPIPFVEMTNTEVARAIHFQGDRFGIQWDFDKDEEDNRYPSYDVLSKELLQAYERFRDMLGLRKSLTLSIRSAECVYVNVLPNTTYADYMLGYLTKWSKSACSAGDIGNNSMFFNVHGHAAGNDEWPTWVQVEAEDNSAPGIELTVRAGVDVEEASDPREGLDQAHENATQLFLEWTSDEMRSKWEADAT